MPSLTASQKSTVLTLDLSYQLLLLFNLVLQVRQPFSEHTFGLLFIVVVVARGLASPVLGVDRRKECFQTVLLVGFGYVGLPPEEIVTTFNVLKVA